MGKEPAEQHREVWRDSKKYPPTDVGARIEEIDRELENYSFQAANEKERALIEERREAEERAARAEIEAGIGALGENYRMLVAEKLAAEVFEHSQIENKHFDDLHAEKKRLENFIIAQELVAALEGYGVRIPDESRLVSVLTSNELIDIDRRDLMKILGADKATQDVYKKMANDRRLVGRLEKLQQGAIASAEYRDVLQADDLSFADWRNFDELADDNSVGDPNDEELVALGIDGVKQIVRSVLTDPSCNAGQGMFWNVLISERSRYVVKAERQMQTADLTGYQRRALFRYPTVRDGIGKRFLPRQAVVASEEKGRLYVIQEKLDLDKMIPLTVLNIDDFIEGQYAPEIKAALADEDNRKEFEDFIIGVERLRDQNKLLIDPIGKNVFLSLDHGRLSIKLADYGCFEMGWDEKDENSRIAKDRAKTQDYIAKLKKLVKRTS